MNQILLIGLLGVFCGYLAYFWAASIGPIRAVAAALCRFLWVVPILLSLSPETVTEVIPSAVSHQPIHIFVDDSKSMMKIASSNQLNDGVVEILKSIESDCRNLGCLPKITKLSDIRPETKKGYSPLGLALESWLFKTGGEPWILLSDGADSQPSKGWDEKLQGKGKYLGGRKGISESGLVLGFGAPSKPGFWIEAFHQPNFAFEGRSTEASVTIGRASVGAIESVQIQALMDGKLVATSEVSFGEQSLTADGQVLFPTASRGSHMVSLKVLPVKGEKDVWDNEVQVPLTVMPNTIGVLHLLGEPSWDGRFLRRYLKAEPKFDLISFFILRDKWDIQDVSEREMSLIAFPVERLFNEELANFRTIVLQDFTMHQFLDPQYQTNLVKFVKEGGGLLFIGGPRALTEMDVLRSPMTEILPFTIQSKDIVQRQADQLSANDEPGKTYDASLEFKIELAKPDEKKRSLAGVYDGWEQMGDRLASLPALSGLHRIKFLDRDDNKVTPLLNARLTNGDLRPLAMASYPGKGRAIWILTDEFWKLGMIQDRERSRFDYQDFYDKALTWLVKGDRKPILSASSFQLDRASGSDGVRWSVRLSGPASRYVGTKSGDWHISVCNELLSPSRYNVDQISRDEWGLSGSASSALRPGVLCEFRISTEHPAFGSVDVTTLGVLPELLTDDEMSPSPRKLKLLGEITGAKVVTESVEHLSALHQWIESWTGKTQSSPEKRYRTIRDFYWVHGRTWIWIVLFLVPLEVLLRRWHLLVGRSSAAAESEI